MTCLAIAAMTAATIGTGLALGPAVLSSAREVARVELELPPGASLPELEERSVIYDSEQSLLAVIDREVSRRSVPLAKVPRHVREAIVAAEDRRFYEHEGYDVAGIARATVANVRAGAVAEGGSTITQQLAKSQVGAERTLERKANELLYAMALEERFTKDQLLEQYLNQVYFGSRAYGIAAAAEEFFRMPPRKLEVDQAALLASLIRSPNASDPREHPGRARGGRDSVLRAMADEGYISERRMRRLLAKPLTVETASPTRRSRQPHVVEAVERELLTLAELGEDEQQRLHALYYGGLRITTTLDVQMQNLATDVIKTTLPSTAPTAAIATVEPSTGEIKAIASGLGYRNLEYNLATQGRRQPGSSFKPFVYAAALQDGFPPDLALDGRSPAFFDGVADWEPDCPARYSTGCGVRNYGGASFGTLDMAEALEQSVNTAAAQLTISVGPERVMRLAGRLGIDIEAATNDRITESVGLGGLDQGVTPLEMAGAYSVLAGNGTGMPAHLIARVEDRAGNVLYDAKKAMKKRQVLDPLVGAAVTDMLRGAVESGTGTGAALPDWPVAGKTGTTTNNVDAWFVGYTPALATAVWVGHPRGQVAMPGMTGGSLPATVWRAFMERALAGRPIESFPEPDPAALAARLGDVEIAVPRVVGESEAAALEALRAHKLVGEVETVDSSAPAGTVVWQSPSSGASANPGSTVVMGVSDGDGGRRMDFPIYIPPPLLGYDD